jgi:hypothetical protein
MEGSTHQILISKKVMVNYYKLKDYKFLKILHKNFKNPKKGEKHGHIFLDIDFDKYHKFIDKNYDDYLEIIKDIHSVIGYDFYFQKYPNLRYNTKEDKYPVWHSDQHFGHHSQEVNVMIPITKDEFGFEYIGFTSHLLKYLPKSFLNLKSVSKFLELASHRVDYLDKLMIFDSYHVHTASNRNRYKNPRMSIDLRILPVNHKKNIKNH